MTTDSRIIAFYGTLMRGGGAQERLGIEDRLRFVGPCQLRGTLLDLGAYPGLVDVDTSDGTVEAEMFELLDDEVLSLLDDFEGYYPDEPEGSFYIRRSLELVSPNEEAWVYVYLGDRSTAHIVESGRWSSTAGRARDVVCRGTCSCGEIRFQLTEQPLFVHGCHCRYCQRESGSAFAINALIESEYVELSNGEPEEIETPSASGRGQTIVRCPGCHVAIFSHYAGSGRRIRFVRVGTLAEPDRFPPDIHIYTQSKQPWVVLPDDTPAVPEYYDPEHYWPEESLARRKRIRES